MEKRELALDLMRYIDMSPCSYFAVQEAKEILNEKGFRELKMYDRWKIETGDKCYVIVNGSAIAAFVVGKKNVCDYGFKIVGAHTDSPGFRLKHNAVIKDGDFIRLNTEVYGGPILSTWFDRPLSIAGRVAYIDGSDIKSALLNIDENLCVIPNLCIHMNREVNKGFEINPQKHTLPIIYTGKKDECCENYIQNLIEENLGIEKDKVIDYDLYLYDRSKAEFVGKEGELVSAGRLDNLAMVHCGLTALMNSKDSDSTIVSYNTDNEEVGSKTVQGADSMLLATILRRISISLGASEEDHMRALDRSFIISADLAHAYHPNFSEEADVTNRPQMGAGPVIKVSASKSYVSDAMSSAEFINCCEKAKVPYQFFSNRSDKRGGSTIGPITEGKIMIKGVDVGNAIWAMHSVREIGSVEDHYSMYKTFLEFFK